MKVGLVLDDIFLEHETPRGHPERADRLRAIQQSLLQRGDFSSFVRLSPKPIDDEWLEKVHTPELLARVAETAGRPFTQLDPDTSAAARSAEVARLAAGSVVEMTRSVLAGEMGRGFAAVRPPGHHAESSRIMGFCLYNNIAAAAAFALSKSGIDRVAIIDFDVHHGNGTQEIFYSRSDVLYISSHQSPLYPGTGSMEETGRGEGQGFTFNLPLRPMLGDGFVLEVYRAAVVPVLRKFDPDLLLVSAGYDAHRDDPLAQMQMTEEGFGQLSRLLCAAADELCGGKVVFALEGGYNLDALSGSVSRTLDALQGEMAQEPIPVSEGDELSDYLSKVRRVHGRWF